MNKFSILNVSKGFSLGILQNYLAFIPAKKYIKYFSSTTRIELWKFIKFQKKILKIKLNQTAVFYKLL